MQQKSARGIGQQDVWAAADALIAEGLRPTIERVRLKIGRGSPNTVSPLLEAWFATLAPRLGVGVAKSAGELVPALVLKAMTTVWETAQLAAREDAALQLVQQQQAVANARTAVLHQQNDVARREQSLQERQSALDDALVAARSQITDLTGRLETLQLALAKREAHLDTVRAALEAQEKQRDADRLRVDEERKSYADEKRRLEERTVSAEHRLLGELDRERQRSKQAKAALADAERSANAAHKGLELTNRELVKKLHAADVELGSERKALALSAERTQELRGLLEQQRAATGNALEQLERLVAELAHKPAEVKPRKRWTSARKSRLI